MFKLYTDGGARGNPGPAAAAFVLYQGTSLLKKGGRFLGHTTNNQAEYQALILGLEAALKLNIKKLVCFLDSELIVKQLKHQYKIKDKNLAPLFLKVWNLSQRFQEIKFQHIYREQNKEADYLVNLILDQKN